MNLLSAAKSFVKKGLSVVATDANKIAVVLWGDYQKRLPTEDELKRMFSMPNVRGLAILCGPVSGNLEVIDIDTKYDLTGSLFDEYMAAIHDASPGLIDKLMVIQTRSGGYHLYYTCSTLEGNQKLAQRPATAEEVKENPKEKVFVLIETRGQGGYVIAPPTEGYEKKSGTLQEITIDERETLLTIARSFNQLIIEQPKPQAARSANENFALTPWEDYNHRGVDHMLSLLESHGWVRVNNRSTSDKVRFRRPGKTDSLTSGDYSYKLNLFMVFTTSSVFEPQKGYKPSNVFTVLECNGDFKAAARRLSEMGYGEKKHSYGDKLEKELFQKKTDGYTSDELKKLLRDKHRKEDTEAERIVETLEKQWGERLCIFWDVDKNKKLQINRIRFVSFLNEVGGFGLYFYDIGSTIYRVVRTKDGLVEESSTEQMKKFILEYIDGLPDTFDGGFTPLDLKELVIRQYSNLFNEGFLEFLPSVNLSFLKDSHDKAFFPFTNGVVVIDKDKVRMDSYKNLDKVIWKNQVTSFHISIDQTFDPVTCEYFRFIEKISGGESDRITYCITLIGYMLHRFKDPAKPYAMVLAEETENDKDGGGTGKGIFIKALSYLLRTVKIDGKNFKIDKNFSLQRVSLDTQLIVIEDCDKNIDFEKYNSQITEGSTVEKKNKDELFIDYKDSPKFAFTTNYSLNIKGNHGKRRSKIFEFAPFFGPHNTPLDFFGHLLFEDWDKDEWNRFYNFMFFCLSCYLMAGIKETHSSEKMIKKQIKIGFTEDFFDWFMEYLTGQHKNWVLFRSLYNDFLNTYDQDKKEYSSKRFKKALEISAELIGGKLEKRNNRQANNSPEYRIVFTAGMKITIPTSLSTDFVVDVVQEREAVGNF